MLTTVFAVGFALALASAAPAAEFHVAPDGQDTNPGTRQRPFATLQRARDAVRELKAREGGVTVWVHPGAYRLTESFALTEEDSGAPDAPIIYRGTGDGEARLVGGPVIPPESFRSVTDAATRNRLPEEARDKVLMADLKELGLSDFGEAWPAKFRGYAGWPELFVEGQPMLLARWPNQGFARIGPVVDAGSRPRYGETPDRPGTFTYEGDRPARWLTAEEVYLSGFWTYKWYDEALKVAQIDPDKRTITFAEPCMYGLGGPSGGEYFALGLLEELDTPGEYYFDRTGGQVYLWPPTDLAGKDIAISFLQSPLVTLTDTSHVVLRDLVFEFSRGSAATISGGTGNLIAGCTVRNIASDAIRLDGGTDNGVRSCNLYGMGGGGISLNGGDRPTLTPCGNYAENNHLHDYARLFRAHHDAINLNGVGCRASHNLIHDAPHHAMDFGGNDHLVELNEIHHVCMETDDAGAIYAGRDWTVRGTVIRNNFFHHVGGGPSVGNQAIYLDDTACGTISTGNVIADVYRAFLIGGGRDNVAENNLIVNCPVSVHIDNRGMGGEWLEGQEVYHTLRDRLAKLPYQEEPWRTRYPELANILETENGLPAGNRIARNIMVRCGGMSLAPEAKEHSLFEGNWETNEDPGFVDPDHLDFTLKDGAAAFEHVPGFEAILFREIGLQVDEYRPFLPAHAPWIEPQTAAFVGEVQVTLGSRTSDSVIRYTTDGTEPGPQSARYESPITLKATTTIKAVAFGAGGRPETRSGVTAASFTCYALDDEKGLPLSALQPTEALVHGGLKRDAGYDGAAISIGGRTFEAGLITHPETTAEGNHAYVIYSLAGQLAEARRFTAYVGIDGSAGNAGSCKFAVELLRGGEWQRVFESDVLRGGGAPAEVDVDLTGAEQLKLIATDAGDNIYSDHAAWGEAMLR